MVEIPGYTLQRPLGRGGMAVVYLATQQSLHRDVALKVLSPSSDPAAGERFLREARLAANLHHPHIVPIHDFGVHEGQAYLAMEYVAGGSVAPLPGERLTPSAALRIVRDIAGALDYAHQRGVIHRDIKPDNILRGEHGGAVLSDFGIARLIQDESALTREGCSVGTPHYMSPEQLRGDKLDGRSDLYSLGVVLWQLLTGELPYSGSDGWAIGTQHLNADIPRLPPGLAHLQALVDSLMAKRADARPDTGADVVRRIDALLFASGTPTPTFTPVVAPGTTELPTGTPGSGDHGTPRSRDAGHSGTPGARDPGLPDRRAAKPVATGRRNTARAWTVAIAGGALALVLIWLWLDARNRNGSGHDSDLASAQASANAAGAQSPAGTSAAQTPTGGAAGSPPPGTSAAGSPSLAVLPFDDLSEKHDQSYFSDGIAEELSNRLAQVVGLRVAGRSSSQSLKDKHATIADVGQQLNVNRVLQGSVRRNGDRLRVTVQLSNVADGFQLWSETYDRKLTDVFAVQDEIAGAVVEALRLKLLGAARRHTPSVEVYDLFLRGRQAMIRSGRKNSQLARDSLRQAVALDPAYAEAYALLGMVEVFMAPNGQRDPKGRAEARQRAMAAAERAVAIAPELGDGYGSRGFLRRLDWDWTGALADSEKSVALGPMDGRNHLRYAVALLNVGRLREAEPELKRAIELEPLFTPAWHQLGVLKTALGDFAGAREAYRRLNAIDPNFFSDRTTEAELLLVEGKAAEARAIFASFGEGELGVIMADYDLGKKAEARQALDRLAASPRLRSAAYNLAETYAWLGENSKAFEWFDVALADRSNGMVYLTQDPLLRTVRSDPRYAELLRKLGIPVAP